jgi:putative hydrolase of the HAD superfamily
MKDYQNMPTRSVLLFDLGGVLVENEMFSELRNLMAADKTQAELIELWLESPFVRKFELGRCSKNDFARGIITEFDLSLTQESFLEAFKSWPKGFYAGVEPLLAQLRHNHTVCCLSNSNTAHWSNSIAGKFDHAFSSHIIGHIKPDVGAFEYVLTELDVSAREVHFFDDAEANVTSAQRCGFNAYQTVGFDEVMKKLVELGFFK